MIRNKIYFEYAGVDCRDYGIYNVNLSSGMLDESFIAPVSILEHKIRGRDKPYFKRKDKDSLTFNVSFSFDLKPIVEIQGEEQVIITEEQQIRNIANWLTGHSYYQPLSFIPDGLTEQQEEDYPKTIYYALVVEDSRLLHNSLYQGFINLTFRCDSPWGYLATEETETLSFSGVDQSLELINKGDFDLYPILELQKTTSAGSLKIENTTNNTVMQFYDEAPGTGYLKLTGTVYDGETVEIGTEIYEFDTGDGIVETGNILVDVSATAVAASSVLNFLSPIKDKDSISIGKDTYEYSIDDNHRIQNIKIDISENIVQATGVLTFSGNPEPLDMVIIGNRRYVFDRSTSTGQLKISRHGVENSPGAFCIVNQGKPTINEITPYFVKAIDQNYLQIVNYTNNNPFAGSAPTNTTITGQQQGDIIEIYNGKTRHPVGADSTSSIIFTDDTYGLRTGDLVAAEMAGGTLELRRVISVTRNSRIVIEDAGTTPTHFYAFARVALRSAEGAALDNANVVNIGANAIESASNLYKAITLEGIAVIDYGAGMIENQLVEAEIDSINTNKINLTSKFPGAEGNQITTSSTASFPGGFANTTLVGGQDCPIATAITKLVAAIGVNETSEVSVISSDATSINLAATNAGSIGNGLIGLANNDNVSWDESNFTGGQDPTLLSALTALNTQIGISSDPIEGINSSSDEVNTLTITHKKNGLDTNIHFRSDAVNIFVSGSSLINGRNQLIISENLIIDTERQSVISDQVNTRFDTFNHEYIKLNPGVNNLSISGDCNIKFIMTPRVN